MFFFRKYGCLQDILNLLSISASVVSLADDFKNGETVFNTVFRVLVLQPHSCCASRNAVHNFPRLRLSRSCWPRLPRLRLPCAFIVVANDFAANDFFQISHPGV